MVMEDRNPMSEIQNIEAMEAQVIEIKQERKACKVKTLGNLDKLHKLLNGNQEKNSEEEAVALPEPAAQV
jgi:hypothetical protein